MSVIFQLWQDNAATVFWFDLLVLTGLFGWIMTRKDKPK